MSMDPQIESKLGERTAGECNGPSSSPASVARRDLVKVGAGAMLVGAIGIAAPARRVHGAANGNPSSRDGDPQNAVQAFYRSLSESQLDTLQFPFDHDLRQRINANWNITEPRIRDDFYSAEQRRLMTMC